jgi:hypothetical protein
MVITPEEVEKHVFSGLQEQGCIKQNGGVGDEVMMTRLYY